MAEGLPNPVKGMNTKTLLLIGAGGLVLGIAMRYMRKDKVGDGVSSEPLEVVGTEADISLPLSASSTGNLSTSDSVDIPAGRDTGTISLPVVKWAVVIDGVEFLTDGVSLWPTKVGEVHSNSGTVVRPKTNPLPKPKPPIPTNPTTPTQSKSVVIKRGDTLTGLVRAAYPTLSGAAFNSKVRAVASANGLTWYDNNTKVRPFNIGQTINL